MTRERKRAGPDPGHVDANRTHDDHNHSDDCMTRTSMKKTMDTKNGDEKTCC